MMVYLISSKAVVLKQRSIMENKLISNIDYRAFKGENVTELIR